MTSKEFNLLFYIKKYGIQSYRKMQQATDVSIGSISQIMKEFSQKQYVDQEGITEVGIEALKPYKVDNAIILAAGMGSHFIPLTLEKPKGLLSVKNQVLIERQIEQLQEAGIQNIIIILGYKKEAFFYLESKYSGIRFVINPEFHMKHNPHSLFLAAKFLGNSYICSSDNYYTENPFEEYVYQAYYSGCHTEKKLKEWYMDIDSKGYITNINTAGNAGYVMLGHSYWNQAFSRSMAALLDEDHEIGYFDQQIWEYILKEKLNELPPIKIKEYPENTIFEFDSLDELREFDHNYIEDTHTKIMHNIANALQCSEREILNFKPIMKGLTNSSFVFEVNKKKYVYRHPGEGTEKIISRNHEKKALELAKSLGIDPTFICMDEQKGWKISEFVSDIRTPDYSSFEDSKRVVSVLKKLHERKISVPWSFAPWEEAEKLEIILRCEKGGISDPTFDHLKKDIEKCFSKCVGDGIEMCFCHCDTYAPNWMLSQKETILIDWEYAGNADPGCDIGTYIMDSMWEVEHAEMFIREYCGEQMTETQLFHFLAYTALISYYWYVWALYREACGAVMGESLYNWHVMAKRYSQFLIHKYQL